MLNKIDKQICFIKENMLRSENLINYFNERKALYLDHGC